jgi:succinate-acetate transporter protein
MMMATAMLGMIGVLGVVATAIAVGTLAVLFEMMATAPWWIGHQFECATIIAVGMFWFVAVHLYVVYALVVWSYKRLFTSKKAEKYPL